VTRGAVLVRAELAVGGLLALLPVLLMLVAPSTLQPMFDDRTSILGVPANMITLVMAIGASLGGWIWMLRISRERPESDRVDWRRSALTERSVARGPLVVAALVCVAIAAIAIVGLVSLPLDDPRIRLRTIAAALFEGAALIGAVAGLGWLALTAWFGGDDH